MLAIPCSSRVGVWPLFCSCGTISGRISDIYIYIYMIDYMYFCTTSCVLNEVPCLRDKTHEVK